MGSRLDAKNFSQIDPIANMMEEVKYTEEEYTGERHPGRWSVLYADGSTSQDVQEEFLSQEYSQDYVNLLKNAGGSKYVPIPLGANKELHLHKWPDLIISNAPKIEFRQEGKVDLCVSKAFASVLHYAGFRDDALEINKNFTQKINAFDGTDPNFAAIHKFAKALLPGWMQLHLKRIKHINWKEDIKQFDIFVAGILGSDGIANHAIAIYNNWIFDANEKIAIPLCKAGLDYCVSTKDDSYEFVKFTSGFYFREQNGNEKQRLKRRLKNNTIPTSINCRESFGKKQKNKPCLPPSKLRKL